MMKRKRLLWQIFPPMVLVTVVAVVSTSFYASKLLRKFYLDQKESDLRIQTQLVMEQLRDDFISGKYEILASRCREIADKVHARVTLILANGEVVVDSAEKPVRMDNHADREEVVEAIKNNYGMAMRFSRTMKKNMLYVAIPVYSATKKPFKDEYLFGVVRLSIPQISINTVLNKIYWEHFLVVFILLLFAAIITLFVSRKISRPLEEIGNLAQRFSEQDFNKKIILTERGAISKEVAGLAEIINKMAYELHQRIITVTKQKNELEAVFKSMIEGVIVVDLEARIVRANDTALKLFHLPEKLVVGRSITQVLREADLSRFVHKILNDSKNYAQDIVLNLINDERHFHVSGTILHDGLDNRIGALVVLNDITKTKKLENMRRDFVANVSHELKTPITSIKGFVETLIDGALENKDDTKKFLEIVYKQANRLNAIVNDLLSLSRIEQEEEQGTIELQEHPLRPVLENCLESCTIKAKEKDITLKLDCDPQIILAMNKSLLEQAVTNLLVNAIKYSPEKSDVFINGYLMANEVCINVIDHGCGIAEKHLSRLFERFYRSDKARSRKLGGTGLGLAIVKHIVQAHNGEVKVKSEPGKGSTFSIILPFSPVD